MFGDAFSYSLHLILQLIHSIGWFLIVHWGAKMVTTWGKKWLSSSKRNHAILMHYQMRREGQGHQTDSVLMCHQDACQVFDMPVA